MDYTTYSIAELTAVKAHIKRILCRFEEDDIIFSILWDECLKIDDLMEEKRRKAEALVDMRPYEGEDY